MELRVDKVLLLLPLPLLFMPAPPLSLPLLTPLLLLLLVIPGALWTSKGSFVVSHRPERACWSMIMSDVDMTGRCIREE